MNEWMNLSMKKLTECFHNGISAIKESKFSRVSRTWTPGVPDYIVVLVFSEEQKQQLEVESFQIERILYGILRKQSVK